MEMEQNFLFGNKNVEESEEVEGYKPEEKEILEEFFEDPNNKFLYETAFAELNSPEITPEQKIYIEKFIDLLTNPPREDEEKEYEKAPIDVEATEALKSKLDIILKRPREILGVNSESENPFGIKVLDVKHGHDETYGSYYYGPEEWEKLTGVPSLFMTRELSPDNKIEKPTIYLSDFHWELNKDKMENEEDLRWYWGDFLHEYYHTQRTFSFGNNHLFRFLDEITTNVTGYASISAAFAVLCRCTKDMESQAFFRAYESSDKNLKLDCLQKIKENFGGMGLLLLGGRQSSQHAGDYDGIREQPFIKNFDNPNLGLMETLLTALDEKSNGEWTNYLSDHLKDYSLTRLQYLRNSSFLLRDFCRGVENADAPLTKKIFETLDEEIAERKKNNEPDEWENMQI